MITEEWIRSLFNTQTTTHLSPLDFRVTAATQFRLLALMCSDQASTFDDTQNHFKLKFFITSHVLSESSFNAEIDVLMDKFLTNIESDITTDTAAKLVMLVIEQSQIRSSMHTNVFEFAVPSWNSYYPMIMTSYPLKDQNSFDNVSSFHLSIVSF